MAYEQWRAFGQMWMMLDNYLVFYISESKLFIIGSFLHLS